jgi:TolA-binding protein
MFNSREKVGRGIRQALPAVLIGALVAASSLGQTGRGRLSGTVIDDDGKPIASARIILHLVKVQVGSFGGTLESMPGSAVFETATNKKGYWALDGLAAGSWEVRASKDGYASASREVRVSQLSSNPSVRLHLETIKGGSYSIAEDILDHANALFSQNKFGEAVAFYKQYLEKDPEAVMVMLAVGDCLRELGNFEGAVLQFQALVDKTSADPLSKEITARALTGIGESYFKMGDRQAAVKYWKMAIETSPSSEVVAANLGEVLFSEGKPDEAIRYYEIAVKIAPKRADFRYKLGLIYLNNGDYEKARACFSRVIEIQPGSELAREARKILRELGQKKMARS